ncbi:hypothetical protein [Microbacterium sp. VKM Ac-2923]|uniref:hypothetical protein n=1 Tax=Microbacterium sp. VKM Ac-2923 TaxID=2929476 RepID=UPI001FB4B4EA|nr:hypothetical protein [Microbacterium sp. VKM Ac-2923]MCJ1706849.1 hypothetical protein [Microbacterium sp. VKM Ac-2923]
MKRSASVAIALAAIATLAGCSTGEPTYAQVRHETIAALTTIVDLIPDPRDVDTGEEQDPYGCSDALLVSQGTGWFYTGHWTAEVPPTFDVAAFIDALPTTLGDGWKQEDLGIDVNFAAVDLVQESTGVSIAVEDHSVDARRVIDVLAISRCGILSDHDRSPTPIASKSPSPARYKH